MTYPFVDQNFEHAFDQALFVVAIVGFLVYYGYYGLWAAFIPSTLSLAIMLWLVWLKVYYDEFSPKRTAEAAGVGEDTGGDAGQTRKGEKSTRAELVGGVKDAVPSSKLQPLMSSW